MCNKQEASNIPKYLFISLEDFYDDENNFKSEYLSTNKIIEKYEFELKNEKYYLELKSIVYMINKNHFIVHFKNPSMEFEKISDNSWYEYNGMYGILNKIDNYELNEEYINIRKLCPYLLIYKNK